MKEGEAYQRKNGVFQGTKPFFNFCFVFSTEQVDIGVWHLKLNRECQTKRGRTYRKNIFMALILEFLTINITQLRTTQITDIQGSGIVLSMFLNDR